MGAMAGTSAKMAFVCARCSYRSALVRSAASSSAEVRRLRHGSRRAYSTPSDQDRSSSSRNDAAEKPKPEPELGPMARRLEEATEEALLTGGRAGRRAVEDAGFSDELKQRLFSKIKDAEFRSKHASAFAEAGLPASADKAVRSAVAAQPWTGEEATQDAVLRMLNDAHKPLKSSLRGSPKMPDLQPIDTRLRLEPSVSPGVRAASAKEAAAAYTGLGIKDIEKEKGLSDKEKAAMKKEFRDRFKPAARAMPSTLTGLASLANERIEDAIARGQFKHIPRGKGVERDTRSDNPFVDTTEYLMNKMIKRQDIVPPWIEKQQELLKAANVFRSRLRNDWKRHAARMIASKGGSLEDQMARAERLARAEALHNPRLRPVDQIAVPTNSTEDPVMVKMREQAFSSDQVGQGKQQEQEQEQEHHDDGPLPPPFRDADWTNAESSYMNLAITNLNALTRSYNLMAPELAKKPYFSLDRELNACFAEVAPQLADAIRQRASAPPPRPDREGGTATTKFLDRFSEGQSARVYDSKSPHYGFKEMWRDLFSG